MSAVADWLQQVTSAGGWMGARIESFSQVLIDPASPYYGTAAWRGPAGALWDIGPHAVALLLWVLGPVERVFANKGRGDHTQTLLVHRSGALSSISLAMDAPAPIPGETAFYGKHGRWAMPPIGDWVGGSPQAYGSAIAPLVSPGEPHPADARFGLAVTRVLWGAEQSQRRGLAIII
ncbi:hypothetical protein IC608_14095 [Devosia sp. PTR5]|uniref:GFO/IDH/MocA-like oxidoreductase domain-containing protein n=1 Tax=Devosia oryzisoli TaxID=2774138 RepID=A0A927IU65_9HYPH|nr:hypothetical protein [Devosia oryzisoli]MBD8066602.1 hypothetical protein [Devosia oryzisoli]